MLPLSVIAVLAMLAMGLQAGARRLEGAKPELIPLQTSESLFGEQEPASVRSLLGRTSRRVLDEEADLEAIAQSLPVHPFNGYWDSNPRADRYPGQAKRGICWQFRDSFGDWPIRPFDKVSWTYNWAAGPDHNAQNWFGSEGIEYVPMVFSGWAVAKLADSIPPGSRHLLGFNEPNHRIQGNMWPKAAASAWPLVQAIAEERGLRLGSPAAAPCGGDDCIELKYKDPFVWFDEFFAACPGCKVDFLTTHYYGCDFIKLKDYLTRLHDRYGRPVWLTEFSCPRADVSTTVQFLRDFIYWADQQPWLERYAWFAINNDGWEWLGDNIDLLVYSELQLTKLGEIYNSYAV